MKKEYQYKIDKILREAHIKIAEIEAEAELENSDQRGQMGFCHLLWATQKRILKEKYGIDWKTPAERNRNILFD
jgi:hypothetical protein